MQLQKEVESESIREAIDDVAEREVEDSYQGNTDDKTREKMKKLRKQYKGF